MNHPSSNEIEISVFGPGYGECIAVHVGSRNWIVIDSCRGDDKNPAALSYFSKIGVDVSNDVKCVLATHWHDDHVKYISTVFERCSNAKLAISSALRNEEFVAFLSTHEQQPLSKLDSGGTEMLQCLKLADRKNRKVKPILEDTIICDWDTNSLSHGKHVRLRALSPSGKQFHNFLQRIGTTMEQLPRSAKKRICNPDQNSLSIVSLLELGNDDSILFGADLENSTDTDVGWGAVVNLRNGRMPLSSLFKIPHHGSSNAHNNDVWAKLIANEPCSITTPWKKGGKFIPSESDKHRISKLSGEAYLTIENPESLKKRYSYDVRKQIKNSSVKFSSAKYRCGHVRVRFTPGKFNLKRVDLFNGAKRI